MVQFKEVDEKEIVATERKMQGTVSYPLLKAFMETGMYMAKIPQEEFAKEYKRDPSNLAMTLRQYAKKHKMPVTVVVRNNVIYFKRLDIDKDKKSVKDWEEKAYGPSQPKESVGEDEI